MKKYRWDESKDQWLANNRQISFGDVLEALAGGGLLDTVEHNDQRRYKGQKMFIIQCRGYVYLVPFVESENEIFLKTIIPSRKYTRRYKKEAT